MIQLMGLFEDGRPMASPEPIDRPFGNLPGNSNITEVIAQAAELARASRTRFVWVALFEATKIEMDFVTDLFELPELQAADALNYRQRAKLEFDSTNAFMVFKLLEYIEASSDIETGQMSVFVGPHYVITVRHRSSGSMAWVVDRLAAHNDLVEHGPLAVLHAVLDNAVDEYLDVIDEVTADISAIEEAVFSPDQRTQVTSMYELKRENLEIRRAVSPMVQIAHALNAGQKARLPESLRPYFDDISDHVLRAGDSVDNNDSLLLTMLMAATARADLQQNSDMRRISAWVAIAAVPTMIAGIYGMNFDDMPELHWALGYPLILLLMASACSLMYRKFRKSGWL